MEDRKEVEEKPVGATLAVSRDGRIVLVEVDAIEFANRVRVCLDPDDALDFAMSMMARAVELGAKQR